MNWFNGNISELKKIPVISRFDQIFSTLCILQGVFAIYGNILWNAEEKQWPEEENKTKALRP